MVQRVQRVQREGPQGRPQEALASPTLFHEPWWLDAVAGDHWRRAEVSHNGRLVGWMPYVVQRRKGFNVSELPPFTYVLGPVIAPRGQGKKHTLQRIDIQAELASQLPRLAHMSQPCHPGVVDLLGFQASGFESFAQFSAEIDPAPRELLWAGLSDKTRNVIRRAQESGSVGPLDDPQAFVSFYEANVAGAGERNYMELGRLARVWDAVQARGCGLMLGHRDTAGVLTAAAFFVWDASRLWYLLSTRDPARSGNGTMSLLLWHGIQQASLQGLVFDFHGIATAGSARFFAGFGARTSPRLALHRSSVPYAMLKGMADALRGRQRNCFVPP